MKSSSKIKLKNPDIRRLYDLKKVLYDQEWLEKSENFEVYYMYRGIKEKNGLRYDITVIPHLMLGVEFNKTKGHYHPEKYGEIYQVLSGKAFYLMQKINDKKEIVDIYAVEAKEKECAIVPPGYGHVTINHGKETLEMANWIYPNFEYKYEPIEEKKGAAYYYTEKGWIKNENYKKTIPLRFEPSLKSMPRDLSFLK